MGRLRGEGEEEELEEAGWRRRRKVEDEQNE
jgi:hypothetical protein